MPLTSIPPLDVQAEHLEKDQYPSARLALLVAAIAVAGFLFSWAAHQGNFAEHQQLTGVGHHVAGSMNQHVLISSRAALPRHK